MELVVIANSAIVLVLCVLALKCNVYKENWLQHAGLWAVSFACLSIFVSSYYYEVTTMHDVLLTTGLSLYALGTTIKVWRHRRDAPPTDHHRHAGAHG